MIGLRVDMERTLAFAQHATVPELRIRHFFGGLAQIARRLRHRFGDEHGQGAVMGLVSTVFCVSNIVAAVVGSVLALVDTRAILGLGALLSGCAAAGLARRRH